MKIEKICLGHLSSLNKDCKNCIKDEYNVNCPDYVCISKYEIIIKDKK